MIRYALNCGQGHTFEEWFSNSADYDAKAQAGALACPSCGDTSVSKAIMAPNVASGPKSTPAPAPSPCSMGGCGGGACPYSGGGF